MSNEANICNMVHPYGTASQIGISLADYFFLMAKDSSAVMSFYQGVPGYNGEYLRKRLMVSLQNFNED